MKIKLKGKIGSGEVWLNDKPLSPEPSQAVYNHSPTGFSWGYEGSGPAQLALAILLEFYERDYAMRCYQDFKCKYIAQLPQEDFEETIDLTEWEGR